MVPTSDDRIVFRLRKICFEFVFYREVRVLFRPGPGLACLILSVSCMGEGVEVEFIMYM